MARNELAVSVTLPIAAMLIATGDALSAGNADNLIPALMSLQRWTPFFWGNSARVGSLVPALAMPIQGPVANWVAQCTLTAFAGLACFALIPRYVLGGDTWKTTGPIAACLWLLSVSRHVLAGWLIPGQPYGVGIALGLAALLVGEAGERRRDGGGVLGGGAYRWQWRCAGALLLVLAFWVHSGLGIVLLPLWAARRLLVLFLERDDEGADPWAWAAPMLVGALQASWLVYYAASDTEPRYLGHVALRAIPGAISTALSSSLLEVGIVWVLVLAAVVVGTLQVPAILMDSPRPILAPLTLAGASLASAVPVVLNAWVDANQHSARYYMGSMVVATCAVAAMIPALEARWKVGFALALPLLALLRFGGGTIVSVRTQLAAMAPFAAQADGMGCTALSGDYWSIWPEVLGVLEARHQRGETLPVYGLTDRGEATLDLARAVPGDRLRVCRLGAAAKR